MKIKISHADAKAFILNRFYNLGTGATEIEIEPPFVAPANEHPSAAAMFALAQVVTEFPTIKLMDKIPAIKRLRELVPGLGLAEAKKIIEALPNLIREPVSTARIDYQAT